MRGTAVLGQARYHSWLIPFTEYLAYFSSITVMKEHT